MVTKKKSLKPVIVKGKLKHPLPSGKGYWSYRFGKRKKKKK